MSDYKAYETSVCNGQPLELYKFSQAGADWFFTSGDKPYDYGGMTYLPEAITRGEIDQKNDATASSVDITTPRSNPVAAKFIAYNPSSPVWITIYRLHYNDYQTTYGWFFGDKHILPPEVKTIFVGRIVSVTFPDSQAIMKCSPLQGILDRNIPRVLYQSVCNHVVYSQQCGVSQGDFSIPAQITDKRGSTITSPAFASLPGGWLTHGILIKGNDICRMITSHVGNQIQLLGPVDSLSVGDNVLVSAGCDRLEATCAGKFNNRANFLGWTNMPKKNPFDGGM